MCAYCGADAQEVWGKSDKDKGGCQLPRKRWSGVFLSWFAFWNIKIINSRGTNIPKQYAGKDWPSKYDRVILLIRDPFDTLLAEYNRRKSGDDHTGIAPIKEFSNSNWERYVKGTLSFQLKVYRVVLKPAIIQSTLVIVYLVIVEYLEIVDKTRQTDFLLSKLSCNSGFFVISLNL